MGNASTLASMCVRQIEEMILNGDLRPGEKLKGEYLRRKLNTGLSPIREALAKLANSGLVECRDQVGFKVSSISLAKVEDVFKTHAKIECLMLAEAIDDGDEEWEGNIMAALYRLAKVEVRNSKFDYQRWSDRNEDFHHALVAACQINGLIKIRLDCLQMKDWYTRLAFKNQTHLQVMNSHQEHLKIAELSIARKKDQACAKLYAHLTGGLGPLVAKLVENEFLVLAVTS